MNYEELLEKAREIYENEDTPHVFKAWLLANIIYPTDKSEDEMIRKELIDFVQSFIDCHDKPDAKRDEQYNSWLAWLEKQGEKKTLNADKVIEWLEINEPKFWESPCNPDVIIEQFKEDFGL